MSLAERDALLARLAARGRAAGIAERRTSFESAMAALWQPGLLPPPVAIAPGVAGRWAPAPPAPGQPVLVWFHGGAFQLGSSASHWGLGRAIADASGAAVLLPDYALAPERPFPAARDDAIAVVEALLAGGLRPHRLALGGDSAGGNLAVAALQHRLARAGAAPAACWLVSPYLDLANSRPSMVARRARDRFVDPDDGTNRIYAGTADPADPAVSPLSGRFDAFPPTLVQVGSEEVLFDDSLDLARAIRAAGGEALFQEWAGMFHVWPLFAPGLEEGRWAIAQGATFLRQIFQA